MGPGDGPRDGPVPKAGTQEREQRIETGKEIWRIVVEETWGIGTVGLSPAVLGVRVVKNTLGNVPQRELNSNYVRTPSSSHPPRCSSKAKGPLPRPFPMHGRREPYHGGLSPVGSSPLLREGEWDGGVRATSGGNSA